MIELFVRRAIALVGQASDVPSYTMTPKRLAASSAAVIAIVAVVSGGLALSRSIRRAGNHGRRGAIVALVLGFIGLVLGTVVLSTASGGLGTGNGVAGAVIAVILAAIGIVFGGMVVNRSREAGRNREGS
jgi:FtsH-binding integral membrane protein